MILSTCYSGHQLKETLAENLKEWLQKEDSSLIVHNNIELKSARRTTPPNCEKVNHRAKMSQIICEEPCGDRSSYDDVINKWLKPMKWKEVPRIAIVGQTEIGKTQVLKELLSTLFKEETQRYDYLFYVPLDHVGCSDTVNVLQLLIHNNTFSWVGNETKNNLRAKVIENIIDNKKVSTCIIFDHLGKTEFTYERSDTKSSYYREAKAQYFISRILRNGFGNSQVLILLNPWEFIKLKNENNLELKHVVWVQGISRQAQKILSAKLCEVGHSLCGDKFLNNVANDHKEKDCSVCSNCHEGSCHREVRSLCYVPKNYIRLITYINILPDESSPSLPIGCAALVIKDQIEDVRGKLYLKDSEKNIWDRIGKFAWEEYTKNNFNFTVNDIKNSKILLEKDINIFLTCKSKNVLSIKEYGLKFFFLHLFLQEFLAALWLLSLSIKDFKKATRKTSFENGRLAVIYEFMNEIWRNKNLKNLIPGIDWGKAQKNLEIFKKKCTNDENCKPCTIS